MCSNTRELINLHQKSFIYCVKLNKLIKCSATMALNYHAVQVMWCKHIPRSLSGITSVSQPFCTCTIINWFFNEQKGKSTALCFALFCVSECMCMSSVYVFSEVQLDMLVIFSFLILAYFIVQQFSWTLIENCHEKNGKKCLLFQSLYCVFSVIV